MTEVQRIARHRQRLVRSMSYAFPTAPYGSAEDAVSHAFEVVVANPRLLEEARSRGGDAVAFALLRRIAWRAMRGEWRRPVRRRERPVADLTRVARGAECHELRCVDLRLTVDRLMGTAAQEFGCSRKVQLGHALRERILHDRTDVEAGRMHGVPREYVNRARNWIAEQLAA